MGACVRVCVCVWAIILERICVLARGRNLKGGAFFLQGDWLGLPQEKCLTSAGIFDGAENCRKNIEIGGGEEYVWTKIYKYTFILLCQ